MIRENKLKYLISSILILLPFLVTLLIEDSVKGHMREVIAFTLIIPVVLFVLHTVLLILTRYIDPVKQNAKVENVIFFLMPAISFYTGAIFISLMIGYDLNISMVCGILMGVMFIVTGNYMPKAKRNCTYGIKIKWTLINDDNWVATHRLAGKMFMIAGVIMLIAAFLPAMAMFITLAVILLVIVPVPIIYSYKFYKNQIASGEATEEDYAYDDKKMQKTKTAAIIISVITLVIVCLLMFTGGLKYEFTDDYLEIKPTMGKGIELEYSELKDAMIEYREEKVPGTRVMGYGSAKLLYGQFRNEEFGIYTRYTYTASVSAIVIHNDDEVIVISCKTTAETQDLYDELVTRINRSR